jgi:hypothetical protein
MNGFDSDELFLTHVLPNIPREAHQQSFNSQSYRNNRNLKDIIKNINDMESRG